MVFASEKVADTNRARNRVVTFWFSLFFI